MKKTVYFILALIAVSGSLSAQGFYIRTGGTYGFPVGKETIGDQYNYVSTTTASVTKVDASNKSISASFGAGPNYSIAIGYKFNQNFILDLGGQYLFGNKYSTSNITRYVYDVGLGSTDSTVSHMKMNGFFINPSLVFSAGFGKAVPYGRFGVVFGFPTEKVSDSYLYIGDGTQALDKTWVYKKGIAAGYQAAIGMNWKLSEKFDIYTEVNILNMTWYAKEGELTRNIENGKDVLSITSVAQKQIRFVKSYDPTAQQDQTKPSPQLRESAPLSAVSVQAGLRFTLFQKKDKQRTT